MKLFEDGEYQIRLGKKDSDVLSEIEDYKVLADDVKKELSDIGIVLVDSKLIYSGDYNWHEIVDKMIRSGFEQDPEFDKMCGSNSYSVGKFAKDETTTQNQNCSDECRCSEHKHETKTENMIKFKELEKFDKPSDIVILGSYEDVGTRFDITDDESAFDIYQDGKRKATLSCTGYGSVMTLEDYKKLYAEKGVKVGHRGSRDACGEGGGVELVFGVKHERSVHGTHAGGVGGLS